MSGDSHGEIPLTSRLGSDARRGVACAVFGCAAFAVVEYIATLWTYPSEEGVGVGNALRLIVLVLSLAVVLWLLAAPLLAAACVAARLALAAVSRERALRWPGLLAITRTREGPSAGPPWALAVGLGALVFVAGSTLMSVDFATRFKEPVLRALLAALFQLVLIGLAGGLAFGIGIGLRAAGRALHPKLREANPFGRWVPALGLVVVLLLPAVHVFLKLVPQARELIPWRHLLALIAFTGGVYVGTQVLRVRGGRLLPAERRRRRIALAASAAGTLAVTAAGLLWLGAHPRTKYTAITASPTLARTIDLVRSLNDFDGDGYGSLLGENDCRPFDAAVHPGARDVPDNGIDENCSGKDFSLSSLPKYRKGIRMDVPAEFRRDWNFLLITIDTVRYDHTTMAGYQRDTTPELAKLAKRSTSFTFANAPSAGTMASVPAILTSKFFHSGIALDENVKRGMPPKLKPSNVLLSELLHDHGYRTGAILTHEYFNDWGMEQGFDSFDNTLGKKHDPKSVTSKALTDRAIAWVADHSGHRKWFLWAHYLDPHGNYVSHPGETSYGDSEMDRYDGELHFTDKHIGRLLNELARMPDANNTIVIITSDHGDGFKEHGFINHGQALYRELLNVPLIVYIPDLPGRTVDGVVSPLDIVPTVLDMAGIEHAPEQFEGESLVPQLFYQRDANDRVVFAETNWPKPLRAAVTPKHKLIYKLKDNVYELYDLEKDPWEKRNISGRAGDVEETMRGYLDDWLERVYFSRDTETNQAAAKLADTLLHDRPNPQHPTPDGPAFDGGRLKIIGYDVDRASYRPGQAIKLAVYFEVLDQPSTDYRLQVEGWLDVPDPPNLGGRSQLRFTRTGLFPTSRWRKGEFVRDRFSISIPGALTGGDAFALGMRMSSRAGELDTPTGTPRSPEHPNLVKFGQVPLTVPANPANPPGKPGPTQGSLAPPRP